MNTTLNIQSSYNDVGDLFLRESQTMSKGFSDIAALNEEEQLKFAIVFHLYFGHIELVHSYEQQGMLDSETLQRTYNGVRYYLQFPGVQTWWDMTGSLTFSRDFVAFVENQAALGSDITHDWRRD